MKCLDDAQLQALADGEAPDDLRAHAYACDACAARLRQRQAVTTAAVQALDVPLAVPAGVNRRVQAALVEGARPGATRLRADADGRSPGQRAFWSVAAVAAATIVAVVFVAPLFKGSTTVSAAEILAKSANRLAERATSGIEVLQYELSLDGATREMMPDHENGAYRVTQVIDHGVAGHYLVVTRDAAGQLVSAVMQDPAANRRLVALSLDGTPYRFEFTLPPTLTLSPPEIERLHMQASVSLMQASGNQQLQNIDGPAGRQYRITVPRVSVETTSAVWDLAEAQAVVDATDYHIVEFAVKGTFLKQPYSLSYRLIDRQVMTAAAPGLFDVPVDATAITVQGEGSAVPARDVLVAALAELSHTRQVQR